MPRKFKKHEIDHSITWERLRAIFGYPQPVEHVWERQFDYCDEDLRRLAKTPYEQIDFDDLWYYHHDLAYEELQPDLLNYLFPVCLMDWHLTLMANEPCSHGDSEFHYGVHQGRVFERMLNEQQRLAVYAFFRDSFLERLDAQENMARSDIHWLFRFNSLGQIMPRIDLLWSPWWSLDTRGRAIAALQYCSALIYEDDSFPVLGENDSFIHNAGWLSENVEFLKAILTADLVTEGARKAVDMLTDDAEREIAQKVQHDLADRQELIMLKTTELPRRLSDPWRL